MEEKSSLNLTNPFVGLRSYRYGERLFGRDREAVLLRDLLLANRLVLLHAPSGAGKTSLVEAQLRRLLGEETGIGIQLGLREKSHGGIRVNAIPPEGPPVNRYVYSVMTQLEEAAPESERLDTDEIATFELPAYFKRLSKSTENDVEFLHFDQFEEVVRLDEGDRVAKEIFFQKLGLTLRDPHWLVIFSIQDEFVGRIEPYLRYIPTQLKVRFRLERLDREKAYDAIVKTAAPQREFRDGAAELLVETLVDDYSGFVEPSILQVVCRNLWDATKPLEQTYISRENVKVFDADKALSQFYEDGIKAVWGEARFGVDEETVRNWFSEKLIAGQVRNVVLREEQATAGLPNEAVDQLVTVRLIVGEQRRGQTWYELTHDRLIGPILDSNEHFNEERERALLIQQKQAEAKRRRQKQFRGVLSIGLPIMATIIIALIITMILILNSYQSSPLKQGVLAYTTVDSQEIKLLDGRFIGYLKTLLPILGENPYTLDFNQRCETGSANRDTANTVTISNPAFSTDGRLAFTVDDAERSCIFVETAAGSGEFRQLTDIIGWDPAWSRDGARIAFTGPRPPGDTGRDGTSDCFDLSDIYIMNSDGTGDVMNLRKEYEPRLPSNIGYQSATFSPDGNFIAFESRPCFNPVDDLISPPPDSAFQSIEHTSDIWIVQIETDVERRRVTNVTEFLTSGTTFSSPFWLEQERILISNNASGNLGIFALDPFYEPTETNSTPPTSITGFSPLNAYNPTASPDGKIVIFLTDAFGFNDYQVTIGDTRQCRDGELTRCDRDNFATLTEIQQVNEAVYWTDLDE